MRRARVRSNRRGRGRSAFLCSLLPRGLSGVQLVISDAHTGLVNRRRGPAWRFLTTLPYALKP
ncbi:hypothetical protein AQJ54_39335 [Streptomyces griseorubiginosus]|uniref:Uncharacterized protein n=1 Tax=Streptomyces griseorubiginosus TaxID=67304 RepID=A0A117QXL1_9ACTN|nr:hypothetical protein AQJ54_39335 [Streptomyces griseorubiginosus]